MCNPNSVNRWFGDWRTTKERNIFTIHGLGTMTGEILETYFVARSAKIVLVKKKHVAAASASTGIQGKISFV